MESALLGRSKSSLSGSTLKKEPEFTMIRRQNMLTKSRVNIFLLKNIQGLWLVCVYKISLKEFQPLLHFDQTKSCAVNLTSGACMS